MVLRNRPSVCLGDVARDFMATFTDQLFKGGACRTRAVICGAIFVVGSNAALRRVRDEPDMTIALNAIYLRQRRSLLWSLMRIVRDPQTAEDLVQESYLRVRTAIESRPVEHVEAFLHQTARNLALDHVRRNSRRARFERVDVDERDLANVAADVPSAEDHLIHRERLGRLTETLEGLPARARQVWVLSKIEGWSYPQIAAHLHVSEMTVFSDMKLAMARCMDALGRMDGE